MNVLITKFTYFMLCGSLVIGLGACSTGNNESADEAAALDSVLGKTAPVPVDDLNSDQSNLLDLALGTYDDGTVRGIELGQSISVVKEKETFKLFEEVAGSVGYSVDTEQLETVDVVYYYGNEQRINRISIDVFLNSEAAMNDLWNISARKLIKVYPHTSTVSASVIQLSGNKGKVIIEKISDDLDHGLKFSFESINTVVAFAHR